MDLNTPPQSKTAPALEWQTIVLAVVIYTAWLALTLLHAAVPPLILAAMGGWIIAWQGSLQHETIHGHPTPWRRVNMLLGWPPLNLWLPYAVYKGGHQQHHASEHITHPRLDTESRYLAANASIAQRWAGALQATLFGRLVFGPILEIGGFLAAEAWRVARGMSNARGVWLRHLIAVSAIAAWLHFACSMPLWKYAACFVYPGLSLSLIRSFAEHRAAPDLEGRAAIVESSPILGLLFLNNNLHAVHHTWPGLPWWELPRRYREDRGEIAASNGGLIYQGYGEIFRRFFWRSHDALIHPAFETPN